MWWWEEESTDPELEDVEIADPFLAILEKPELTDIRSEDRSKLNEFQ